MAANVGDRFGRWLVLERQSQPKPLEARLLCRCDCGTVRWVREGNVTRGVSRSCGCLKNEATGARRRTHGCSATPIYGVWLRMRDRCENPANQDWLRYGGRGIAVCAEWQRFETFARDMGPRPPGLEIDRIDNNGDYEPGNCRWATRLEQANNVSRNHLLEHDGVSLTVSEWSRRTGIKAQTILARLRVGYPAAG